MRGYVKEVLDIVKDIKCVRKVARGVATLTVTGSNAEDGVTITLSGFTDVNKMVVILDGGSTYASSSNGYLLPGYVSSLSTNELVVMPISTTSSELDSNYKSRMFSYQVIEFY